MSYSVETSQKYFGGLDVRLTGQQPRTDVDAFLADLFPLDKLNPRTEPDGSTTFSNASGEVVAVLDKDGNLFVRSDDKVLVYEASTKPVEEKKAEPADVAPEAQVCESKPAVETVAMSQDGFVLAEPQCVMPEPDRTAATQNAAKNVFGAVENFIDDPLFAIFGGTCEPGVPPAPQQSCDPGFEIGVEGNTDEGLLARVLEAIEGAIKGSGGGSKGDDAPTDGTEKPVASKPKPKSPDTAVAKAPDTSYDPAVDKVEEVFEPMKFDLPADDEMAVAEFKTTSATENTVLPEVSDEPPNGSSSVATTESQEFELPKVAEASESSEAVADIQLPAYVSMNDPDLSRPGILAVDSRVCETSSPELFAGDAISAMSASVLLMQAEMTPEGQVALPAEERSNFGIGERGVDLVGNGDPMPAAVPGDGETVADFRKSDHSIASSDDDVGMSSSSSGSAQSPNGVSFLLGLLLGTSDASDQADFVRSMGMCPPSNTVASSSNGGFLAGLRAEHELYAIRGPIHQGDPSDHRDREGGNKDDEQGKNGREDDDRPEVLGIG